MLYCGWVFGSIGDLGVFLFYEIKNVIFGEGGVLFVNLEDFLFWVEIFREKGINCSCFFCNEVDKYMW